MTTIRNGRGPALVKFLEPYLRAYSLTYSGQIWHGNTSREDADISTLSLHNQSRRALSLLSFWDLMYIHIGERNFVWLSFFGASDLAFNADIACLITV